MITADDVERIARRVIELQGPGSTTEVLTAAEARQYVKRPSKAAFSGWCKTWGIKPAFRGRYSRTQLDLALNRESRRRAA